MDNVKVENISRAPDFSSAKKENQYNKNSRIYVLITNETVAENFCNRKNRPHNKYRLIVKKALADMDKSNVKFRWSQTAGCSCPCSPGFIANTILKDEDGAHIDLCITI